MNRYNGNTGVFERVPEAEPALYRVPPLDFDGGSGAYKKTSGQSGILGGLGGMLSKLGKPNLELEDIILVAVLYLLYRESGDIEFLLIAGAMLFL